MDPGFLGIMQEEGYLNNSINSSHHAFPCADPIIGIAFLKA